MPSTYLIARANNFKKDYSISPSVQSGLADEDGLNITEGEPETTMSFLTTAQVGSKVIHIYKIHHDYKVKKTGKVFDRIFHYYLDPKDFYLYYYEAEDLVMVVHKKM